jgi:hypothetical protein
MTILSILLLAVLQVTPLGNVNPKAPSQDLAVGVANAEAGMAKRLWLDVTTEVLEPTAEWTNKVELADLNGDGFVDLLFANGGNYSEPGTPEPNRVFFNQGPGRSFEERTSQVFGVTGDIARVIKARDFNSDGLIDIFVGTTYQTQSRLYFGLGDGAFVERTATHLPQIVLSLGDAEPGDVDGDGDLDLVLVDWGPGNNMTNTGGPTRLWLNDGEGHFLEAAPGRMPELLVRFSWDIELVDVDNDFDLDLLVSSKCDGGGLLLRNDGIGFFSADPRGLPRYTNNYAYAAMDLDGDGFLDLVTINDGEIVGGESSSRREHVLRNDGKGRYVDATDRWWPQSENIGEDDNVVAFLDYDSDGDADFVIGSLSGPDRLLINDGTGQLRADLDVFEGEETPGTLGIALADLNGDHRIDVVQGQGEVEGAEQERIFFGHGLSPDTAAPLIANTQATRTSEGICVRARIHDHLSPTRACAWRNVEVRWKTSSGAGSTALLWYGEFLWRANLPRDAVKIEIHATDAAGNVAYVAGVKVN